MPTSCRERADRAGDCASCVGRVSWLSADDSSEHAVVVVDRYGQVYEVSEASDRDGLPSADALAEWFRFLATACPECGVLDDPRPRAWVP